MSEDKSSILEPCSRRRFLHIGVLAGGSAALGVALPAAANGTSKVAKQTVSYQPTPRGPSHCASCSFFQGPASCNYVDGPISPSGWCVLYQPRK